MTQGLARKMKLLELGNISSWFYIDFEEGKIILFVGDG